MRVEDEETDSRRILYPTDLPMASPRSEATRAATDVALMRRGCVQMMEVRPPSPRITASSRMNCGSCVVLPHPVSPATMVTWWFATACRSSAVLAHDGSFMRCAMIFLSSGAALGE